MTKFSATDTNGFVLKTQYNTDKSGLDNKIDDAVKKIHDPVVLDKFTGEIFNAKMKQKKVR